MFRLSNWSLPFRLPHQIPLCISPPPPTPPRTHHAPRDVIILDLITQTIFDKEHKS